MFQRKLIAVLSVIALLALTAGTGHASLSRVEGMGLSVPALSQFTDDYANIYFYPASVVRQNNLVLAELGNNSDEEEDNFTPSDQSFTLIRNFPRFGVVAVQVKESAQNLYEGSGNVNNEWFDIIWGKAFTKMDFAVRFDLSNSYYERDAATVSNKNRGYATTLDPFVGSISAGELLGAGIELNTYGVTPSISLHMQNDNRLDLSATYRRYSIERAQSGAGYAPEPEVWEDAGNASYSVLARYFMNKSDASQWYIAGWYANDDFSWELTNWDPAVLGETPRSADETYKKYGAGIANNMRVNDNNLLLWGVAVWQTKHTYERGDNNDNVASTDLRVMEVKSTTLPVLFAAVETQATSWLKVRIGATNMIHTDRDESSDFSTPTNAVTVKSRISDFNLSLGTGIRWNNLDIDMTLNEEFPFTGGNVLSGSEQAAFTRVSATYHY